MFAALCVWTSILARVPGDAPPQFPRFPPVAAKETVATFQVRNGFRLDLVAAEPLVMDPVAAAFDEDGRLYVVEMSDYPHVRAENDKPFAENMGDPPVGRVRILTDEDDDGVFDRSTVFADKLSWPTGIAVWKGGVYVAATPDVLYLKDTDGDLKADVRETVFTGFRKFNVQAVMNNLQWTIEHKIVGAGSSNGGQIRETGRPDAPPINLLRRDFQFDPESREIEVVSGGARFGNAVDDWGNRFLCDIRNPAQHVLIPLKYLERNPLLAATKTLHDAAPHGDAVPVFRVSPPEPWREFRARRWSAIGKTLPRSELVGAGYLTSSSGLTFYRGDAYPPEYRGNLFLGEVANNLIFRMKVEPDGVTFKAERADKGAEFIASADTWFRPVNFVNAPDGTLYALDMYRETIEHPWSIPDDIRAKLDLRSGEDRGRIYRITPPGFSRRPTPKLSRVFTDDLVKLLSHPNAWHRDTAHRLIFERGYEAAVPALQELFKSSPLPLARLHALWSLRGLGAMSEEIVVAACKDADPEIRIAGIRLAGPLMNGSAPVRAAVLRLSSDDSKRVRFQAALTAGGMQTVEAVGLLHIVLRLDPEDAFVRLAVMSASKRFGRLLFRSLVATRSPDRERLRPAIMELAELIGAAGEADTIEEVIHAVTVNESDDEARAALVGVTRGLRRRGASLAAYRPKFNPLADKYLLKFAAGETATALDARLPEPRRLTAVELVGGLAPPGSTATLITLLDRGETTALRQAALPALASLPGPDVAPALLKGWRGYPPALRAAAVDALLSRRERIVPLLEAVGRGLVAPGQIPLARRDALRKDRDEAVRTLAAKVFPEAPAASRAEAIASYRASVAKAGDPGRGRVVFDRECASCHRLGERGFDVGPNLAGVLRRTPDELLIHILDPNREVSPDYVEYAAALKDGRSFSGILVGETAAGVTLRKAGGVEETFLRGQVEELAATGKSLMPEGLEKNVKPDEMADLLGFLLDLQKR